MFTTFAKQVFHFSAVMLMLVSMTSQMNSAQAAPYRDQRSSGSGPEVISALAHDESQPLSSMIPIPASDTPVKFRNRLLVPKALNSTSNDVTDISIVQTDLLSRAPGKIMAASVSNFDGIGATGYWPPDTNGDVGYSSVTGRKYYMQTVNASFQIWDVTNPAAVFSLYGPAPANTLWSGLGSICGTHNDGDPIVLFDHLANRWLYSQFAYTDPNDYHQCIAVSTSADPTGSWYRYDFLYSTTTFNDYPKFGVWPDGYYLSVNQFDGSTQGWAGAGAVVFDRIAMLSGLAATMVKFDLGEVVIWYGLMLPSDLDGVAPPAGTPNYFIEWDDSTWHDDPTDTLRIWNFHVDWANPANSTFGTNALFDPNAQIATANLDSYMCEDEDNPLNCIPQLGTTQKLDAIAFGQLMHRLQYRNFGSYQTLVGNQTVDANSADKAGVYWFELRNNGAGWGMNQQGVYAPDTANRWMGSVAMDKLGNIALGYSVSSASIYPSIRYTGRLASDPPGTLPQGETTMMTGGGSQAGTNRWGDYSMMAVDPTDDCSFWYTQEYYSFTSFASWKTRIGSFQFPSCAHTISGNAGAAGVTLSYTDGTDKTATSLGDGSYSFQVSGGWSGSVIASHPCYTFSPASIPYTNVTTNRTNQDYTATFNPASGCAHVDVTIGEDLMGNYRVASGEERREYYAVSGGPVKVESINDIKIVSAIRLQSYTNDTLYSFVETMGVPSGLLSYKYYFPTYNNTWAPLNSQLRFANLDANATTIRVTIGTTVVWEQSVAGQTEQRLYFPVSGGPVIVESLDTSKKIIAAIRLQSYDTNTGTLYSFAETMGIPVEQLSDTYSFPTYNNTWAPLNSQVRFGNLESTTTRIRVTIGNNVVWEDDVPGREERRLYFDVSGGPVKVESLDPTKQIVAAIRLQSYATNTNTLYSFVETMGVPAGLLSHKYYFPTYNNTWAPLNSQIRFANLESTTTRIRVTIGGVNVWEQDVPGQEERRLYFPVSGGPVIIESLEPTKKIVAAIRLQSYASDILYSFAETLGIPAEYLSDLYYFPTYNNIWPPLNSQLRFGVP